MIDHYCNRYPQRYVALIIVIRVRSVMRSRNDAEAVSRIFFHAPSARNLHSGHRRKSNSSRLEEGNPANESTILKEDSRDDVTNTRGRGAPNLTFAEQLLDPR